MAVRDVVVDTNEAEDAGLLLAAGRYALFPAYQPGRADGGGEALTQVSVEDGGVSQFVAPWAPGSIVSAREGEVFATDPVSGSCSASRRRSTASSPGAKP